MAIRKSRRRKLPGGMTPDRKKCIQVLFFLVLILIGVLHLRTAFLAQLALNKSGSMRAFSSSLTDPDALAYLARQEHLIKGNLPRAFKLYQQALTNFVLHIPSWLGLAELYNDMGEQDRGVAALRYVQKIAPGNGDRAWTMALLANDLESEDILSANLRWLAVNKPGKRNDVFALADLYWQDPQQLLALFDPSLIPDLLDYYVKTGEAEKAVVVWQKMEDGDQIPAKSVLEYVNFLLGRKRVEEAGAIWRSRYQSSETLLFNPDLHEPFTGSGFGWRINRPQGVTWQQPGGSSEFIIKFDGRANPSFNLSQIVPLSPGTYTLSGFSRSEGLSTDQRPYWFVSGFQCTGLSQKSEMLPTTSERNKFSIGFTVPPDCAAVQISFRRDTSYYFNNKIAGTVVLDGLHLERTSGPDTDKSLDPQVRQILPENRKSAPQPTLNAGQTDIRIKKMKVN